MRIGACAVLLLFFSGLPALAAGTQPAVKEYRRAGKMFSEAKYAEAIPLYEQVLTAPPEGVFPAELHTRIGDSHFRLGNFGKALGSYRSALRDQKRSERAETQYWIGFCCFLLGRDAEAVAEFLKIPELYPEAGMWISTAYYWAARASERLGWKDRAAEYYRKAGGAGKSTQARHARGRAERLK